MLMAFVVWGCQTEKITLKTKTESIEIKVRINPNAKENGKNSFKVKGAVEVINITGQRQNYGNKFLFLVVSNSLSSPTYKNTIASEFIDFSHVQVEPNASINFPAYWVFETNRKVKLNKLHVTFDENMLGKHLESIVK